MTWPNRAPGDPLTDEEIYELRFTGCGLQHLANYRRLFSATLKRELTDEQTRDAIRRLNALAEAGGLVIRRDP